MAEIPDEAHGRVTNPERYRVVQDAARRLIEELREAFDVHERPAPSSDPVFASCQVAFSDMVQLVPTGEGTTPITLAFSDFPSVFLRSGAWQLSAYPGCGCDACDEDPHDVAALLRHDVEVVAAGGLSEEWDGEWMRTAWVHPDGSSSSGGALREAGRELLGEPRRYEWRPWQRKAPSSTRA
ncbi:MAG: DUF6226 family protein [Acidimicrobiales bacterium]